MPAEVGLKVGMDVSSAARSRMNTGIQRVIRSVYEQWEPGLDLLPLVWESGDFRTLSSRQVRLLRTPFAGGGPQQSAHPEREGGGFLRAGAWWDWFTAGNRSFLFRESLKEGCFFEPEIFSDERVGFFKELGEGSKVRRVAFFHDALTRTHPQWSPEKRRRRFDAYLSALAGFDAVVANSQASAEALEQAWKEMDVTGRKGMVKVEKLPVMDGGRGERPRLEEPDFNGTPVVLSVGSLEPRKNHPVLIDAAEALWQEGCEFELVLVGRQLGGGISDATVDKIQERLRKGRPLKWLRHVDDATLEREYRRCCFTVFPSLAEGFGLPVVESVWHGRPCLCGEHPAILEAADGGGCLHVDTASTDTLAEGMRTLLASPEQWRKLFEECAKRQFRSVPDFCKALEGVLLNRA